MLLKHVKDIDIEDEYIKVDKDENLFDIAQKLIDIRKERSCDVESEEIICAPVLAAYVIENGKPIGVISEENIMEAVVLQGKDPKTVKAKDVMKPPNTCNINQDVQEALNLIIDKGLLTLAVLDGDQLVSVISVFDAIFLNADLDDR